MKKRFVSPLDGRVGSNFGGSVNNRTKKIVAGLLIAILGPLVATTLAATVTIGSGTLEFGQGSQAAVACDISITTSITESWYNSGPYFRVATIVLSGLNTAAGVGVSDAGCSGKVLKVSLLGSDGTALVLGTSGVTTSSSITISNIAGTQTIASNGTTASLASPGASGELTITVAGNLNASTVYRVAVETS